MTSVYVSRKSIEFDERTGSHVVSCSLNLATNPGIDLSRHFDFEDADALARAKADLRTLPDQQIIAWASRNGSGAINCANAGFRVQRVGK
jgi:hypothetical protein